MAISGTVADAMMSLWEDEKMLIAMVMHLLAMLQLVIQLNCDFTNQTLR